jgi:hypothetical protein
VTVRCTNIVPTRSVKIRGKGAQKAAALGRWLGRSCGLEAGLNKAESRKAESDAFSLTSDIECD